MPTKSGILEWVKDNVFGFINLGFVLVVFAFNYGVTTAEMKTISVKVADNATKIEDMVINGHPSHELRIAALEKRTDDLAVLKSLVGAQSEQIKQLAGVVSLDHDSIIRVINTMDRLDRK